MLTCGSFLVSSFELQYEPQLLCHAQCVLLRYCGGPSWGGFW